MKNQKTDTRNHLSGVTDPAFPSLCRMVLGSNASEVPAVALHIMCLVWYYRQGQRSVYRFIRLERI